MIRRVDRVGCFDHAVFIHLVVETLHFDDQGRRGIGSAAVVNVVEAVLVMTFGFDRRRPGDQLLPLLLARVVDRGARISPVLRVRVVGAQRVQERQHPRKFLPAVNKNKAKCPLTSEGVN